MNSKKPLISIIVPSFNSGQTLERSLRSVVEQDYPHKQLIVIDGGSKDESVSILKKYQSGISYWISEPDRGIAHAWNKGLAQAKGEWICFLGSDDVFLDKMVFTRMVPHLVAQPENIRVVYGTLLLLSNHLEVIKVIGAPWEKLKRKFIGGVMLLPHPGTMHHKSLFQEHGFFNEDFKIALDYEFLLRELKQNDADFINNLITVGMLDGGTSNQAANKFATLKEVRKALRLNGLYGWNFVNSVDWLRAILVNLMIKLLGERITNKLRMKYRLSKSNELSNLIESKPYF
jgi:hypothetical protein